MGTFFLVMIGLSFLGFIGGLLARNTGNSRKKTFRRENFYTYLTAVSVILLLVFAFLYNIFCC